MDTRFSGVFAWFRICCYFQTYSLVRRYQRRGRLRTENEILLSRTTNVLCTDGEWTRWQQPLLLPLHLSAFGHKTSVVRDDRISFSVLTFLFFGRYDMLSYTGQRTYDQPLLTR